MRSRRIALGAIELSCIEVEGEGRTFVLLHGLTGHRDDFRARLPELGDLGPCLVPDLRGHGDFTTTGELATFSFPQLVADLAALFDAEGLSACDLLGHSFGGMLALRFALEHPERVASLILMNTAPFAPDGYSRETFVKAGAIALSRGMAFLQQAVEKTSRANPSPDASDRQTEKWAEAYWRHHRMRYNAMDPAGYAALGLCMMDQESQEPRLGEIACPTTVLVGSDDVEFLRGADALEAGIPQVSRFTLPDAGHHPHMENPRAWSDAVREHLARARG